MPRRPFHWTIALFAQKYIPHISDFTFLLLNQVVGEPGSAALPGGVAQGASTLTDKIIPNARTFELIREEALNGQCTPCYKQFLPGLEEPEKSADAAKSEILS